MATGKRARAAATGALATEIKLERMRRKATDSRYTQTYVAMESGVPLGTLKAIETGKAPVDMDQLFALAEVLDVDPSVLVKRAEEALSEASSRLSDEARDSGAGGATVLGAGRFAGLGVTADVPEHVAAQITKRSITEEQEHWD